VVAQIQALKNQMEGPVYLVSGVTRMSTCIHPHRRCLETIRAGQEALASFTVLSLPTASERFQSTRKSFLLRQARASPLDA